MAELRGADLAVVIPTRDRWPILQRTLAALRSQTVAGFEVIVVVDGTDQQPPALDGADLIVKPHGGAGAARNRGVRATRRPLILFLGDDMIPEPRLVEAHLAARRGDSGPELAVLGHVDWHSEVAEQPLTRWLDRANLQFDYPAFAHLAGQEIGFGRFFACNLSVGRGPFLAVGGFDETFHHFYEDVECGLRMDRDGTRLIYAPAARAHHLHSYDAASLRVRFERIAVSERLMTELHPDFRPWFRDQMLAARRSRTLPRPWRLLDDHLPRQWQSIRPLVEPRADRQRLVRLATPFLRSWERAAALCELRRYLGDSYDPAMVIHHSAAVEDEAAAAPDELSFYRSSRTYLYDLTVFAMSGTKDPYLAAMRRELPPGARVLDYGCGLGSDGLALAEEGYRVDFADFANPSTEYLRWRLGRRGVDARVFDIERDVIPGGYEAVFAFDVLEHVDDPFAVLQRLEQLADLVVINLLEPLPGETRLHHPLPVTDLLDHVRARGLVRYRRLHNGRSHLVLYRPHRIGGASRLRSVAALQTGRLAAWLPPAR